MSAKDQPAPVNSDLPLVIVGDRFAAEALAELQGSSKVRALFLPQFNLNSPEASECEALIVRTRIKVNEELLTKMPKLKLVITATSGFDHFDFAALEKHKVKSYFCPQGNRDSAAELTWSLVLACARKIPAAFQAVQKNNWNRDALWGSELSGKTYGVIGLGRIGKKVARIAKAFDMNVAAYDPYVHDDAFSDLKIQRKGFIELLRESDIVSLHVPYSRDTHHMINRHTLIEMNSHAIFINTSRGSVVRETDLSEMLMQGELAAAGLDVFEREPLAQDSLLLNLPHVVLTPHVGANTHEAFEKVSRIATQTVLAWATGNLSEQKLAHPLTFADLLPPRDDWFQRPKGFNS